MKKILRFGLVVLFAAITGQAFSQGGNTCAAASGSPISIPFSANGSTCGSATDNYDDFYGTAGTCINTDYGTYFTSGPDWIYYFCATQSGPMTISLTSLSGSSCFDPTSPYAAPSVAVWTGCPSSGNCVAGGFNNGDQAYYGTTPEMGVAFTATAGQCYYVSIDADAYYCDCFNYHIDINYDPVTGTIQPACTNMGFDDGTFNGWQGTYSYSVGPGATGAPTPNYVPIHSGFAQQHTITTGGNDPVCGFPMVCPGFGPNSMMLGDGTTPGYGGATLEQTFQVTASNAYLNYRYAVVIQDAGHPTEQQPFFKIEVFDCSGNPIQCGQYLVVGGPGIPGFQSAGSSIYYKTWTPVFIDLTPYIGSCATVRFTVGDCSQGGHFAYVYLDADCDPMAIVGPTHVCPGGSTTLTAPGGAAAYNWTNPSGPTTQTVSVSPTVPSGDSVVYACTVTSVAGPTCTTVLNYTVTVDPLATVTAANDTTCTGSPGTLTTTVTPTGGTYSWTGGGGTGSSMTLSPASTTPYTVTYTNPTGCTATATATIVVNPKPTATVPPNASYCVGATVPAGTFTVNPVTSTVSWTNNNPGIGLAASGTTTTVPSFTATAAGTAVITVTPTGPSPTNCVGTPVSYTITINPPPTITANTPTVCAGSQATLTATGASTYTWSPAGVTNGTAFTPTVTSTYTVIGTDANGCKDTTTSLVTVNPLPVVTVTSDSICPGETATMTASGATSYTWSSGATSSGGSGATATAQPSSTTTYVVTGTTNGCSSTATATVTLGGIIPVTVNSPTICLGATASLTATSSASSYTWQSGITSTGTNTATVSPASTTVYSVTAGSGGCSGTANFTVTVNPLPPVSANSPTVCTGGTVTLNGTGATSYTWNNGVSDGVAFTPAATGQYIVTGTDGNNCSNTYTTTVTVNPLPTVSANNPTTCAGGQVTLSGTGATSYSWNNGVTDGVAFTPSATGQYIVTGTDANSCSNTYTATVTVNPLPTVTVPANAPYCVGATVPASSYSSSLVGTTYTWVNNNTTIGLGASGSGNAPSFPATDPGATPITGVITVTPTSAAPASCVGPTSSYTITVNPLPVVTVTSPSICATTTATLTASGATTYSWSTGVVATSATTGTVSPTGTSSYVVTGTDGNNCSNTATATVTVNPLPVSNAGNDVVICSGTPTTIGSANTTNYTYSWTPSTGLSSSTVSNPSITTVNSGTTAIVTNYIVTTTDATTGCTSTDNVSVTVNYNPILSIHDPAAVCSPTLVDITGTGVTSGTVGTGTLSYWQDAMCTVPLSNTTTIPNSGTFYIKIVTAEGCSDTASVNVVVNPLPISDAGADQEFCTGGSAPIGATADPANSYSWNPSTGLNSSTVANPTVTLTNGSSTPTVIIYTVTTTSSQGCISQDNVHVTVHSNPTANAGSAQIVCSGGVFTLSGAVGGSATGGTWSSPTGGTFSALSTDLNAVYHPSTADYTAGSVTLTLTANDAANVCPSSSSNVVLSFYPLPVVDFVADDPDGCPVHCANFTDNTTIANGDSIQSWEWIYGDGSAAGTAQNPSHCYSNSGFYDVTLIATSNHGCKDTLVKPKYIDIFNVPVAEFTPMPDDNDGASIFDSQVTLVNGSSSDVISWTYSFGDGDSISPSTPSPVHVYPNQEPMTYIASLYVENSDGCTDYVEHPVVINPEFTFYIPNAFSPNDDGINDFFYGTGIGIVDYDIYIFDRWGMMIFHGKGIDTSAWNGHANEGRDVAQQDVYIWKVKLSDIFGKRHEYHGHVTLVR